MTKSTGIEKEKQTLDNFLNRARIKHGDKYDYSLVYGGKSLEKIQIICPIHGEFSQVRAAHLRGQGCKKCVADSLRMGNKEFVERSINVHGDAYTYECVDYQKNDINVIVTCPIHGNFEIRPAVHLKGQGCNVCSPPPLALTIDGFLIRAEKHHRNKYDYSKVEYLNGNSYIKIICPIHGDFTQRAENHLSGRGCMSCKNDGSHYNAIRRCKKSPEFSERIGSFYVLEVFSALEKFYKVGVSTNLHERLVKYNSVFRKTDYSYNLVYEGNFTNYVCALIENDLLKGARENKTIYKPSVDFAGKSECISKISFDELSSIISEKVLKYSE